MECCSVFVLFWFIVLVLCSCVLSCFLMIPGARFMVLLFRLIIVLTVVQIDLLVTLDGSSDWLIGCYTLLWSVLLGWYSVLITWLIKCFALLCFASILLPDCTLCYFCSYSVNTDRMLWSYVVGFAIYLIKCYSSFITSRWSSCYVLFFYSYGSIEPVAYFYVGPVMICVGILDVDLWEAALLATLVLLLFSVCFFILGKAIKSFCPCPVITVGQGLLLTATSGLVLFFCFPSRMVFLRK